MGGLDHHLAYQNLQREIQEAIKRQERQNTRQTLNKPKDDDYSYQWGDDRNDAYLDAINDVAR